MVVFGSDLTLGLLLAVIGILCYDRRAFSLWAAVHVIPARWIGRQLIRSFEAALAAFR